VCTSVVAVGASAGGVQALIRLAAGLPRDLGYAVKFVQFGTGTFVHYMPRSTTKR